MSIPFQSVREIAKNSHEKMILTDHAGKALNKYNLPRTAAYRVIANGTIQKQEADEQTNDTADQLTKFTIEANNLRVTVKNSKNPVILSVRRIDG